jgi:hypothetical protein
MFSAFFIIPAFFEKNLTTVQTMTQGYFNYIIHFATLNQLFISRFWGYGASLWGPVDDMSFQIGVSIWLLAFVALFKVRQHLHFKIVVTSFLIGLFALFLTHNKSTFIWQLFPFLAYYQFPWRFLGLTTLMFSIVAGSIILPRYITALIIFATIILNISYFKEDIWQRNITDLELLTPAKIYEQSGAGLRDYWPKYSTDFPTVMAPTEPIANSGNISIIRTSRNSRSLSGKFIVNSASATINFPITYFPNWQLTIDGNSHQYEIDQKYGQIMTTLNQGEHSYRLDFTNTPIRIISNFLTLAGIFLYIIKLSREKKS